MITFMSVTHIVLAACTCFATVPASGDESTTAGTEAQSVRLDVCIVRVPAVAVDAASEVKDVARPEEGERTPGKQRDDSVNADASDGIETRTVGGSMQVQMLQDGWQLLIGDQRFTVAGARLESLDKGEGQAEESEVIASPSMLVRVGEPAAITIGQVVSYMQKLENGDLRLVVQDDCVEGVEVQALVSEVKDGLISLEELSVSLKTIESREPIEGIPFDVGRPVIKTQQVSCSLRMAKGCTGVVPLPIDGKQPSTILLLIAMRIVPAQ